MVSPYVVLIGGAPGAGKTTLGRALAIKLGAAWLTVDDLSAAARAVTTPESNPGLHVMSRAATGFSSVQYFTETPLDQLIADTNEQHEAIWPAVEAVIQSRLADQSRIVIDGWYFRPEMVDRLGSEDVKSFWITIDRSVLEKRERKQDFFYSLSTDPERMLQNALGRSYWYNDLIRSQASDLGMPILHQDGTASVDDLCDVVMAQLPR